MKQQYIDWIEANIAIFKGNAMTSIETRQEAYNIYNDIFNENKRPNSCGRCWANVKEKLFETYLKTI